jgi:hypothetical protein
MKFSLKHILTASTLLLVGASTSLFGDLADTITQWLTSGEDRYEACQKIGKYGRTLAALPSRKIKTGVLEKCEFELLGIDRKSPARDIDYNEGKREKTIHPYAWQALSTASISNAEPDTTAQKRREELKKLRKQKKSDPVQREKGSQVKKTLTKTKDITTQKEEIRESQTQAAPQETYEATTQEKIAQEEQPPAIKYTKSQETTKDIRKEEIREPQVQVTSQEEHQEETKNIELKINHAVQAFFAKIQGATLIGPISTAGVTLRNELITIFKRVNLSPEDIKKYADYLERIVSTNIKSSGAKSRYVIAQFHSDKVAHVDDDKISRIFDDTFNLLRIFNK